MTQIIRALSEISDRYRALFVDLWGCVHNGIHPYPAAVEALRSYRSDGGIVVLVTNSPRPRADVERQLTDLGVARDAWDTIASSGDSARAALFRGVVGSKVFFIGNEKTDAGFFEPLHIMKDPVEITRVALDEAEGIVCTGPFNPNGDLSDLRPELLYAKQKGLKLLCANPDIIVDRGDHREWCAGAVAKLYTEMGGESLYFGKPHPPIYDLARRRLAALGADVADSEILAIGDGIGTDIKGAIGEDIDSLFLTGGLAAKETGTSGNEDALPDEEKLHAYLAEAGSTPTYTSGYLR